MSLACQTHVSAYLNLRPEMAGHKRITEMYRRHGMDAVHLPYWQRWLLQGRHHHPRTETETCCGNPAVAAVSSFSLPAFPMNVVELTWVMHHCCMHHAKSSITFTSTANKVSTCVACAIAPWYAAFR